MQHKKELLKIGKASFYILFLGIVVFDLVIVTYFARFNFWASLGYADAFNKSSVLYFLYEKSPYFVTVYILLKFMLLTLPLILGLIYVKKRPILALCLLIMTIAVSLLFEYDDDICWKWINDNIYNFGFYLM